MINTPHLSIFSDSTYLPNGAQPTMLLSPFWQDPVLSKTCGHYDYALNPSKAKKHFTLTSLDKADLAILPSNWTLVRGYNQRPARYRQKILKLFREFSELLKSAGKPLVVFFEGDFSQETIPITYDYIFRTAEFRSIRELNSFVYPPFCVDLVNLYFDGKINIRKKSVRPTVSFCGKADQPPQWFGKRFYRWARNEEEHIIPPIHWGYMLRGMVLNELSQSCHLDSSFIIRDNTFQWSESWFQNHRAEHAEFVHNIVQSDYVICTRGTGNFSCRFYEALCCGRIPVLIDTDNVLPFEFAIDWNKVIVRISPGDHGQIADRIMANHEKLSEKEFIQRQKNCRQLWKEYLSAPGFYSKFHLHF